MSDPQRPPSSRPGSTKMSFRPVIPQRRTTGPVATPAAPASARPARGRGAPRGRGGARGGRGGSVSRGGVDIPLQASGPLGQGPGGPPRSFARSVGGGASMVALPEENARDAPATFESQAENKVKAEDVPASAGAVEEVPAPDLDPLAPRALPPPLSAAEAAMPAVEARAEPPQLKEGELYLFQFPTPFPGFVLPPQKEKEKEKDERRVAFREDTAGGAGNPGASAETKKGPPDGRMGTLKMYPDGRVRLVLGRKTRSQPAPAPAPAKSKEKSEKARPRDNQVTMDVHRGSSTTFLEQAMLLDPSGSATTLGSIKGKFVLTPDLDAIDT